MLSLTHLGCLWCLAPINGQEARQVTLGSDETAMLAVMHAEPCAVQFDQVSPETRDNHLRQVVETLSNPTDDPHAKAVGNLVLSAEYQPIRCGQCGERMVPGSEAMINSVPLSIDGKSKRWAVALHLREECAPVFAEELKAVVAEHKGTDKLDEWLRRHHAV